MIEKEKLVKIAGASNVTYDRAKLDEYSRDISFVNTVRPECVVKPTRTEAVQHPVRWNRRFASGPFGRVDC